MEGATFQHSNLLLLVVVSLFQRQGEPLVTLILLFLREGDPSMIVGFCLDPLGEFGYPAKEGDSFTREGNRREPLIGVGDDSTIVGFCLVPDRACWIRATVSRTGPRRPWGSGVSGLT